MNDGEIEGFMSGQKFRKLYEKKCEPLELKYDLRKIELDILIFLERYTGCDTAKDIVTIKCLSKAHVSKAVENLTNKRYLMPLADQEDRRCVHLLLTEEARPVLEELRELHRSLIDIVFTGLTEEERAILKKIAGKISGNIDAALQC